VVQINQKDIVGVENTKKFINKYLIDRSIMKTDWSSGYGSGFEKEKTRVRDALATCIFCNQELFDDSFSKN